MRTAFCALLSVGFLGCPPITSTPDSAASDAACVSFDSGDCDEDAGGNDAGLDAGLDGGLADSGICTQCPRGARCSESAGCAYFCGSCARAAECGGGECRFVSGVGYCVGSIPACAGSNPAPQVLALTATTTTCRTGVLECHLLAVLDHDGDSLQVTTQEYHFDGGVQTRDAGLLGDAGLANFWRGANAWCLTSAQFSVVDDCFTHDWGLKVQVSNQSQAAEFEYYRGSGLKPPLAVEIAVEQTLRVSTEIAEDAGAW